MGSSGTIPLSIVSVIPDIMRHYADLIVHAQHEVFLATNYWENSHSAGIVTDSLRELSKRCVQDNRTVVVKLMYDRGTPSQILKNHADVPAKGWQAPEVGLPSQEELKNISMQVVNYHRPPLGTFHAKYLVVDRNVACLNSNNIQDRPNVEMMVQLEGPIVESFYDMALVSWANAMNPPLPLIAKPPNYSNVQYKFQKENDHLKCGLLFSLFGLEVYLRISQTSTPNSLVKHRASFCSNNIRLWPKKMLLAGMRRTEVDLGRPLRLPLGRTLGAASSERTTSLRSTQQ